MVLHALSHLQIVTSTTLLSPYRTSLNFHNFRLVGEGRCKADARGVPNCWLKRCLKLPQSCEWILRGGKEFVSQVLCTLCSRRKGFPPCPTWCHLTCGSSTQTLIMVKQKERDIIKERYRTYGHHLLVWLWTFQQKNENDEKTIYGNKKRCRNILRTLTLCCLLFFTVRGYASTQKKTTQKTASMIVACPSPACVLTRQGKGHLMSPSAD